MSRTDGIDGTNDLRRALSGIGGSIARVLAIQPKQQITKGHHWLLSYWNSMLFNAFDYLAFVQSLEGMANSHFVM
jgi:hypothetical protein